MQFSVDGGKRTKKCFKFAKCFGAHVPRPLSGIGHVTPYFATGRSLCVPAIDFITRVMNQ